MTRRFQFVSVACLSALSAVPVTAFACGTDAYYGQVCLLANRFCPPNTTEAAGQVLAISGNEALFSLLSCSFGGDCRVSFALPDLRGRIPVGYDEGLGLTDHPFGQSFGSQTETMTLAQLPIHTHTATFTPTPGSGGGGIRPVTVNVPISTATGTASTVLPDQTVYLSGAKVSTTGFDQLTTNGPYTTTPPTTAATLGGVTASFSGGGSGGGTVTIDPNGGSQPMPTIPPEVALRYCIVMNGVYPTRP